MQCKVVFSSSLQARQFELHQYVFTRISGKGASKELQRFINDSFCVSSRTPNRTRAPRFSVSLRRINKIFLIQLAWCLTQRISYSAASEKTALNSFNQSHILELMSFFPGDGGALTAAREALLYIGAVRAIQYFSLFCCPLTYHPVSILILFGVINAKWRIFGPERVRTFNKLSV